MKEFEVEVVVKFNAFAFSEPDVREAIEEAAREAESFGVKCEGIEFNYIKEI